MLRTDERVLLVDLLTPPAPGYRLEHAVGTTFTMQLESLLRIPLAVVGAEMSEGIDPLGVMEAVRSSAGRIDVFCQSGMLSVPSGRNALLGFLEPLVHQVRRPNPGRLFHPKVWLASFIKDGEERRFRLLCGSRNLTSDRAWDAVIGLDGVQGSATHALNSPLAEFVASLPGRVPNGVPIERSAAISGLAQAVRSATWTAPSGVTTGENQNEWLKFHWLEKDRPVRADLSGANRRLVISPFLNAAGLSTVWPDGDCTVISRPESFAALGHEYLSKLRDERGAELFELNDAAAIPDEEDEDVGLRWSLRGLHAKVIVLERNRYAHVMIGSANATDAAWSGNTEFMVEVIGSVKELGINAALAQTEGGLRSILYEYSDIDDITPDEPKLQEQLEWALVDLAAQAFTAEATPDGDSWQQLVRGTEPVLDSFVGDAKLTVRLLSGSKAHSPNPGAAIQEIWKGLSAEDLTPFVVLELTAGSVASPVRATCVVMATLSGGPEDRIDRLIAKQVGSPEAFLRFLMLLLQLGKGDLFDPGSILPGQSPSTFGAFGIGSAGVLESLVTALADQPQSIDEIDRLVTRLSATAEGKNHLPPGWDAMWSQVLIARETLRSSQ